jgi:hypothetical protein
VIVYLDERTAGGLKHVDMSGWTDGTLGARAMVVADNIRRDVPHFD